MNAYWMIIRQPFMANKSWLVRGICVLLFALGLLSIPYWASLHHSWLLGGTRGFACALIGPAAIWYVMAIGTLMQQSNPLSKLVPGLQRRQFYVAFYSWAGLPFFATAVISHDANQFAEIWLRSASFMLIPYGLMTSNRRITLGFVVLIFSMSTSWTPLKYFAALLPLLFLANVQVKFLAALFLLVAGWIILRFIFISQQHVLTIGVFSRIFNNQVIIDRSSNASAPAFEALNNKKLIGAGRYYIVALKRAIEEGKKNDRWFLFGCSTRRRSETLRAVVTIVLMTRLALALLEFLAGTNFNFGSESIVQLSARIGAPLIILILTVFAPYLFISNLSRTSSEQAILSLAPGVPHGKILNIELGIESLKHGLVVYAAAVPALYLLPSLGGGHHWMVYIGAVFALAPLFIGGVIRNYAAMSRPGFVLPMLQLVLAAVFLVGTVTIPLLADPVRSLLWLFAISLGLALLIHGWRWRKLATWPSAFPMGRLAT